MMPKKTSSPLSLASPGFISMVLTRLRRTLSLRYKLSSFQLNSATAENIIFDLVLRIPNFADLHLKAKRIQLAMYQKVF